jgi:hypothetical protein
MGTEHSERDDQSGGAALGRDGLAAEHVAIAAEDLSDEDMCAIREAQYPAGHDHLNALMNDG